MRTRKQLKAIKPKSTKLSQEQVTEINDLLAMGYKQTEIAKMYGVTNQAIYHISKGDSWGWLTGRKRENY